MLARAEFTRVISNVASHEYESIRTAGGSGKSTDVANGMLLGYQF